MPKRPVARAHRSTSELPDWACWCPAAAERPWTVGVEEEVMLLDPRRWTVVSRVVDVLAALPSEFASHASAETHACVVELKTGPHHTVAAAAAELTVLRESLTAVLRDQLDLRAAAAGTHPMATGSDVSVSAGNRYRKIGGTMRALASREPTMALHVHVAVPDGNAAVRALDGLRQELPLLLALSANSPFWRARDSGFASIRTPIFSMFPRVGIPRRFGAYTEYVRVVEALVRSGAIPDPSFLWWDARVQPKFGTVEVRVMDAQSRVTDVGGVAAIVQCLVRHHAELLQPSADDQEVLAENRFLAARDGLSALLIEDPPTRRRPARDLLARLLETCQRLAPSLGCAAELDSAAALAEDPGDVRQRRIVARAGLAALAPALSGDFAPARRHALA